MAASGDTGRSSLYRYIKTGQLPAHKWRGRLVVADHDFEAFFLSVQPLRHPAADGTAMASTGS